MIKLPHNCIFENARTITMPNEDTDGILNPILVPENKHAYPWKSEHDGKDRIRLVFDNIEDAWIVADKIANS